MIFVVGLTGLVYIITDELLVATASHKLCKTKLGSSRIVSSNQNCHKDLFFNDVAQKDSVFNDAQVAKVDDFAQSKCFGAKKSMVFNDAQEAEVDDFVRERSRAGESKVFNDAQEAKFDDFVQRGCSGVGQCMILNDAQEANIDGFVQRECFGVGQSCTGEFDNEVEVITRKCCFDQNDCPDGDGLGDQVVDQKFEFSGLDQGVEKLFEEMQQGDEGMEDEENVYFNVGDETVKDEEEGWEDDWEGIERTELEKQFGAAVAFVNSKKNANHFFGVEIKVKIKLYGLHKVAIEGICMKPQPMALKVYSRAKWNAWKQLENMSREEAMEKYITLLSRTIPGWREDRHK